MQACSRHRHQHIRLSRLILPGFSCCLTQFTRTLYCHAWRFDVAAVFVTAGGTAHLARSSLAPIACPATAATTVRPMAHFGIPTPFRMKAKKGTVACTAKAQAGENFSVCSLTAPKGILANRQWLPTPSSFTGRACGRSSFVVRSLATCFAPESVLGEENREMEHLAKHSLLLLSLAQVIQALTQHIFQQELPHGDAQLIKSQTIGMRYAQRGYCLPLLCLPQQEVDTHTFQPSLRV